MLTLQCIAELRDKARYFQRTDLIPALDSAANAVIKSDTLIPKELQEELVQVFQTLKADQKGNEDWHPGSNGMQLNLVHPSLYPLVWGRTPMSDLRVLFQMLTIFRKIHILQRRVCRCPRCCHLGWSRRDNSQANKRPATSYPREAVPNGFQDWQWRCASRTLVIQLSVATFERLAER